MTIVSNAFISILCSDKGIGIGTLSYNGSIRFTFGIDESIIPRSERNMDEFMDNMIRELDILKHRQLV